MTRTLILYVFHIINSNVIHFCNNNIFEDPNYQFIIICNNLNLNLDILNIPSYVKIIKRHNIGYDFGGWSDALFKDNIYRLFDYYVFINSSVIGPFIPKNYKKQWPTILTDGLNDSIKLYGSMINCGNEWGDVIDISGAHVQSFAFTTDRIGLNILINSKIFKLKEHSTNFVELIVNNEIRMSREIINNGFNIGCILKIYNNVDFRNINSTTFYEDQMTQDNIKKYTPYEVVFIKTNRHIDENIYKHLL